MSDQLTPGRFHGLMNCSKGTVFCIVAFDQRGSYRRMMPADADYDYLREFKRIVIDALSYQASAVLTDPIYGMTGAMDMKNGAGLLLALEKSGYSGDSTFRTTEMLPGWTPRKAQMAGADAAKLMLYYHPDSGELAEKQEELARQVIAECHALDMPVFLEPMSYSLDPKAPKESAAFAETRPQVVIDTAKRLAKTGADVLKLEFPHDIAHNQDENAWYEACDAISWGVDAPWVLLSAGVDFDQFARQLEVACKGGASGFLAGRAIWKEATKVDYFKLDSFLWGEATERLKKLVEIATNHTPGWIEYYSPPVYDADWYEDYP